MNLSELETLIELEKLCEHIERNGWKHLYEQVNVRIESALVRQQKENNELQKIISELKERIKKRDTVFDSLYDYIDKIKRTQTIFLNREKI
jgi:cell division protein FtsB